MAPWVAIALLGVYVVFVASMFQLATDTNEIFWARRHELFGGIEALAFAAAGFFFGREVHRARAESAEQRADSEAKQKAAAQKEAAKASGGVEAAKKDVELAKRDAEIADKKGRALAEQVRAAAPPAIARESALGVGGTDDSARLRSLVAVVDALYPRESGAP